MATASVEQESAELARFREEWIREARERTTQPAVSTLAGHPSPKAEKQAPAKPTSSPTRRKRGSVSAITPEVSKLAIVARQDGAQSKSLVTALERYRSAVEAEQQGRLDDAVQLYNVAFRLDSHVDQAYHRSLKLLSHAPYQHTLHPPRPTISVPTPSKADHPASHVHVPQPLQSILAGFNSIELTFEPEDTKRTVLLARLPDELVVVILQVLANNLDVPSIERFALVCRKARIVSLEDAIWRRLVHLTFTPLQIGDDDPDTLASEYSGDYRDMFIKHPRVRLDGVYISVCHYTRRGYHENPWVAVSHLITYHRFLRFLPDGRVLSFLTDDELPPAEVVHKLKPSLRAKGHYIGRWQVEGQTVVIEDLRDSEGLFTRYAFEMVLRLQSRPLGRWNRLTMMEYSSINLELQEPEALPLKNERPFWFSKVRSYAP